MNRIARAAFSIICGCILLLSLGCASMFASSTAHVSLESEPSGADVYLSGRHLGKTPLEVNLPKTPQAALLVFKKEGHETKQVRLTQTLEGAAFLNLGFITTTSGATSWGVDLINGKAWKYAPDAYVVHLEPAEKSKSTQIWNDRVFDFVMANSHGLKTDIARGTGSHLKGLCELLNKTTSSCINFSKAARTQTSPSQNAKEMYESLRASDSDA